MRGPGFTFLKSVSVLSVLALTACAGGDLGDEVDVDEDGDPSEISAETHAVKNGVQSLLRPEIASINTGCSGVLIMPDVVLTAGHCLPGYGQTVPSGMAATFQNPTTGTNYDVPVIAAHNFMKGWVDVPAGGVVGSIGNTDVALLRLKWSVPASVATPARIADTLPPTGTMVTIWGYGPGGPSCNVGSGIKRYSQFPFGSTTTLMCHGDSGGPLVIGTASQNGAVIGVNSSSPNDGWGNVGWFKEQILDVIVQWHGWTHEEGVNRDGGDIASVLTTHANACRIECYKNNTCRAYTWVSSGGKCWLKRTRQGWYPYVGATSGSNLSQEANFDRLGSDITSFTMSQSRPELCLAACGRHPSCVAYTYVSPNGGAPVCWLKNATPTPTATSGDTSGMLRGREPNTNRSGRDLYSKTLSSVRSCETECAKNAACKAYTFVPSGSGGVCWIKSAVPAASATSGLTSGVKGGLEPRTYRAGSIYNTINYSASSQGANRLPEVCQAKCAAESACQSWNYLLTRDSAGNPVGYTCYLLNNIGAPSTWVDAVSGIKGAEFFY